MPPNDPSTWHDIGGFTYDGEPVSLEEAKSESKFAWVLPDTQAFNSKTVSSVAIANGDTLVTMTFPPVEGQDPKLTRQPDIKVLVQPWVGDDPSEDFADAVEHEKDHYLCQVGDVPALCVPPNAENDIDHANPAYLEFAVGNLDVEVVGGSDISANEAIGEDMVKQAEADPRITGGKG